MYFGANERKRYSAAKWNKLYSAGCHLPSIFVTVQNTVV